MADPIVARVTAKAVNFLWGLTEDGKPQIGVVLKVTDPDAGSRIGREYTWRGQFSETPMGKFPDGTPMTVAQRTAQSLLLLGARMKDDDLSDLEGVTKNEIRLTITENTWEGKTREQASFIDPIGQVFMKHEMPDAQKKEFAMNFKGLVSGIRKSAAANAKESGGVPVGADGKPIF